MTGSIFKQNIPPVPTGPDSINPRDTAALMSLLVAALPGVYLLLTSTTHLIPGIWPYDAKRILQFSILIIVFLVPALNRRIRGEFDTLLLSIPTGIKIVLLAAFFWGVASVLINADSRMQGLNSFSEVALLTALVLGVFVIAACRRIAGPSFDRIAIGLIALTGLAVGLQELIGVVAVQDAGVDFNFRVALLHFSWPRFYNQVQSWTIPALVALPVLFQRYRLAYFLCALVLGLQWYIILATGARGSFVSIAAAIVFALIFLPVVRARLFTWQLSGFLIGALIFALVSLSFQKAAEPVDTAGLATSGQSQVASDKEVSGSPGQPPSGENSFFKQSLGKPKAHTSGRIGMWLMTVDDIREHPLMGIGPMNYVCVSTKPIGHPHNFPLQLASEWGIPVAVAISLTILYLLFRSVLGIRHAAFGGKEDNIIAGLLLTGILAAGLHACLSGIMVMPASQVTGMLICGMFIGTCPAPRRPLINTAGTRGLGVGILLSVFLLGIGSYELNTMQDRAALLKAGDDMWPRMWQDAKVCRLYDEQIEVNN